MKFYEKVEQRNIENMFESIDYLKELILQDNKNKVLREMYMQELQLRYELLANIYVEY